MATNPFAGAGLGQFGADTSYAAAGKTPTEDKSLLGPLLAAGLKYLTKSPYDLNTDNKTAFPSQPTIGQGGVGFKAPRNSVQPVQPTLSFGVAPGQMNQTQLGFVAPSGISTPAVNNTVPTTTSDEIHPEVNTAWGQNG